MHFRVLSSAILLAATTEATVAFPRSTLNGECTGAGGAPGVCVATASCTQAGGTYISNACPGTANDIKCCVKTSCGSSGQSGDCRWTSQCGSGKSLIENLCPGPNGFKCCVADNTAQPSSGGYNIGEKILAKAKEAEGTPYHWGGGNCKGPTGGGYDCSGLLSWAVCQVTGRDLFTEGLRVTRSMYCASESKLKYKKVPFAQRRAGDAVFFGGACDCASNPEGIHHVGLMMDSDYSMWNALKTGTNVRKDNFKNWSEGACDHVIRFS
ncbi:hypothetical protein GQ43DRAFT_415666 [Delitschia confertaspora ATCC 74209]|uniref:NlpC/P60 domain-containing protein n=1 Tax=Delitschia confertaspora ATCC 74209 TaxID=1513339 RepID=A0A9P4MVU9_9PLEO|nr:hypothetical protein GQ43DRAFT_415666 [Delitschia confertaspora ATCC 74209]